MTKRPSKAEMDERIVVPLDPEKFIEGVLAVKQDDEAEDDDKDRP